MDFLFKAAATTALSFATLMPITAPPVVEMPKLTHQQEVWIYALEFCESRGNTEAINPKDLDGTPSYGAY